MRNTIKFLLVAICISTSILTFNACSNDDVTSSSDEVEVIIDDTDFEATDWTTETHSKDADPDFDEVFEDNAVKRIDIVITESRWGCLMI